MHLNIVVIEYCVNCEAYILSLRAIYFYFIPFILNYESGSEPETKDLVEMLVRPVTLLP